MITAMPAPKSLFASLWGWGTMLADRGGLGKPHILDITSGVSGNPDSDWAGGPDAREPAVDTLLATNISSHDLGCDWESFFVEATTATGPIAVLAENPVKNIVNATGGVDAGDELIDEKLLRNPLSISSISADFRFVSPKQRLKDDEEFIW